MAFSSPIWEVRTTGDDTNNGGGFDTGVAGFPTDGAATVATGSAPVFTSASYTFVSPGDVGAWIFIKSGTNWTPGWYKIASVAGGAATLDAAIGHAPQYNTLAIPGKINGLNTVAGCATVASPTGATWGLDYSQQAGSQFSSSTFAIDATTNTKLTDGTNTIGKNWVGNIISITAGTGFTVQRVAVVSTSGTTATCDKSLGTLGSTSGTGRLGGPFASLGACGAVATIAQQSIWVGSGSYTITSATINVAGGCYAPSGNPATRVEGYATYRGDMGTAPVFTASGIATTTLFALPTGTGVARNLTIDGASLTAIKCFSGGKFVEQCVAKNATNSGFTLAGPCSYINCVATGCSTAGAGFSGTGQSGTCIGCVAYANTVDGFNIFSSAVCAFVDCISAGNTGASSHGFVSTGLHHYFGCVAYGNGSDGFSQPAAVSDCLFINCTAEGNGGWGFNIAAGGGNTSPWIDYCATFNNSGGSINTSLPSWAGTHNIAYTASAFTNAAGNDFSLNNTVNAGQSLRGAGWPGAYGNSFGTTGYKDVGSAQHKDPGSYSGGVYGS
jgi:hypothetical protein